MNRSKRRRTKNNKMDNVELMNYVSNTCLVGALDDIGVNINDICTILSGMNEYMDDYTKYFNKNGGFEMINDIKGLDEAKLKIRKYQAGKMVKSKAMKMIKNEFNIPNAVISDLWMECKMAPRELKAHIKSTKEKGSPAIDTLVNDYLEHDAKNTIAIHKHVTGKVEKEECMESKFNRIDEIMAANIPVVNKTVISELYDSSKANLQKYADEEKESAMCGKKYDINRIVPTYVNLQKYADEEKESAMCGKKENCIFEAIPKEDRADVVDALSYSVGNYARECIRHDVDKKINADIDYSRGMDMKNTPLVTRADIEKLNMDADINKIIEAMNDTPLVSYVTCESKVNTISQPTKDLGDLKIINTVVTVQGKYGSYIKDNDTVVNKGVVYESTVDVAKDRKEQYDRYTERIDNIFTAIRDLHIQADKIENERDSMVNKFNEIEKVFNI